MSSSKVDWGIYMYDVVTIVCDFFFFHRLAWMSPFLCRCPCSLSPAPGAPSGETRTSTANRSEIFQIVHSPRKSRFVDSNGPVCTFIRVRVSSFTRRSRPWRRSGKPRTPPWPARRSPCRPWGAKPPALPSVTLTCALKKKKHDGVFFLNTENLFRWWVFKKLGNKQVIIRAPPADKVLPVLIDFAMSVVFPFNPVGAIKVKINLQAVTSDVFHRLELPSTHQMIHVSADLWSHTKWHTFICDAFYIPCVNVVCFCVRLKFNANKLPRFIWY